MAEIVCYISTSTLPHSFNRTTLLHTKVLHVHFTVFKEKL